MLIGDVSHDRVAAYRPGCAPCGARCGRRYLFPGPLWPLQAGGSRRGNADGPSGDRGYSGRIRVVVTFPNCADFPNARLAGRLAPQRSSPFTSRNSQIIHRVARRSPRALGHPQLQVRPR